ncbi:MAG: hypothetical protein ACOYL6_03850 [Bacteriovoracaceae bacterium]
MTISPLALTGAYSMLPWNTLSLKGSDTLSFLQGQTTNDIKSLEIGQLQYNALVDISGKIESYFLLARFENCIHLYTPSQVTLGTVQRLQKYLITEDVEIEVISENIYCYLGIEAFAFAQAQPSFAQGFIYGLPAFVSLTPTSLKLSNLTDEMMTEQVIESGIGRIGIEVELQKLVNESFLENLGISYSKGCFLGQETVAKIHNFRGPAYYPVKISSTKELTKGLFFIDGRKAGDIKTILKVKDGFSAYALLLRDFRLEGATWEVKLSNDQSCEIQVQSYQYPISTKQTLAYDILEAASRVFTHENNLGLAKTFLMWGIEIAPDVADLYESLGVILGREEKFLEAIELMDKLSQVDENSVMAYTNKSLYLMKLGKIEEAEAAKATATIKSFAYFGNEAKKKNEALLREEKALADQKKRESMFLQVLDIDAEDSLALYGLAEINFERKNFNKAEELLTKVITYDSKYSVAYLLLGKSLESLNKKLEAISIYKRGIPLATAKGDMMPANEMQSRLLKLQISNL